MYFENEDNLSEIMEEDPGPYPEPTYEELVDEAVQIGIDLETEKEFADLVRQCYIEPLPENWVIYRNRFGEEYYFNLVTE
jgi:hypothetical protein